MAEYRQNADWRESEHPRDGKGRFSEKGSSQAKFDEYQSERERLTRKYDSDRQRDRPKRKQVSKDALTTAEWKTFYNKVAEIKTGGYVDKLKSGDCIAVIGSKIVIFDSDYESPKVFSVIDNYDDYYYLLENWDDR